MTNIPSPSEYAKFGEYLKERRQALGKSIRQCAAEIGITPAYLSDIEKGNRNPPANYHEMVLSVLEIPKDQVYAYYDLAGVSGNSNHIDIIPYIIENPIVRLALRKARDKQITSAMWQKIIEHIDELAEDA
ncbi:MAG: helix-turn-helix transcriptional regulator [Oscillospiraceae bacterium]|nr:helix-turn-helix transcriptional regulator [Oscillospiraceae bacterium]